jgi:hypothetical protein
MGDINFEISSRDYDCSVQKPAVTENSRSTGRMEDSESCSENSDSPSEPDFKSRDMGDIPFEVSSRDSHCSV